MSPLDPTLLRQAFGRFITGVTIVTARASGGAPVGFTANSFCSVSLDPPMVLVCPARGLSSFDVFEGCETFAVSVLAEGQEDASNTFASGKGDRFAKVPHDLDRHGVPVIRGAAAQFSCRTAQVVPAGDHCVLIGEVVAIGGDGGLGLGFAEGRYFSRGLERAVAAPGHGARIAGAIIARGDAVLLERTAHGLRPPQVALAPHDAKRERLAARLAEDGITAAPGRAYSSFDDGPSGIGCTYFLVDAPQGAHGLCETPIADLARQAYATPAIARMMARYGREAARRSFGFYLGDHQSGDVYDFHQDRS